MLDEPTSGLDSSTALALGRTLRQEAARGMAILCTIHSPSTDLFECFDRVICMSVGRTIYNGPVKGINGYFSGLGSPLPAYTNPSDYLIRLAIDPKLVGLHYSVMRLEKECKETYVNYVKNMKDEENFNLNLTQIEDQRSISFSKEYFIVLKRFFIYTLRDPRGMISITVMGLFIGLIFGLVYQGVGEFIFGDNPAQNIFLLTDFTGPALNCAFDGFGAISLGKLLSTHVLMPVYVREV